MFQSILFRDNKDVAKVVLHYKQDEESSDRMMSIVSHLQVCVQAKHNSTVVDIT